MAVENDIAVDAHAGFDVCEFRVAPGARQWWWADDTFRLHGFEPGEVVPTTALVLSHVRPNDREPVAASLAQASASGTAFHLVHHVLDVWGQEKSVVFYGLGHLGARGQVTQVVGAYIDLSGPVHRLADHQADVAIRTAAASRSTIEQAKGIVATVFDVGEEAAFQILRHGSNTTNIPLRDLAAWLLPVARQRMRQGTLTAVSLAAFLQDPAAPPTHRA